MNNNTSTTNKLAIIAFIVFLLVLLAMRIINIDGKASYLQPLSPGVYWHNGRHLSLQNTERDDIANSGVIIGTKCVAVIDSGGSLALGKQLLTAIRTITKLPICYIINTHIHYDHILGNAAFIDTNTKFVGHHKLSAAVERNQDFFQKRFSTELAGAKLINPSILVKGEQQLDLGGRMLELRSWQTAHSHTDLTVYDPTSGSFWTGDLVFRERLPRLDGSLRGWLEAMKQLKTLPARQIIPGHGAVATNWDEALTDQNRYLTTLLNEVRAKIKASVFVTDALKTVGISEKEHWQLFEAGHKGNVSRAFTELEWE